MKKKKVHKRDPIARDLFQRDRGGLKYRPKKIPDKRRVILEKIYKRENRS